MHFQKAIRAGYVSYLEESGTIGHPHPPYLDSALGFFRDHVSSIEAFRRGAFATVDEFCKLVSQQNRSDLQPVVDGMRQLTRFVLALSNPEHAFHDSDYYPFIQRLFQEDLSSLRDDIAVLTFNYDPYLDYLLLRAVRERSRIKNVPADPLVEDAVTSGFISKTTNWIERPGFKLLKLHGTIYENAADADYEVLFEPSPERRIQKLIARSKLSPPPIVFPWEIFSTNGEFKSDNKDFVLKHDPAYLPLFKGIWECAREEIYRAERISFIGLSMHPFLRQAMRYLFGNGRGHQVKRKVVVADTSHEEFTEKGKPGIFHHPEFSPAKKLEAILQEADEYSKLTFGHVSPIYHYYALNSFREFIEKGMDPNRE